jgi:hypothetical protein
MRRSFLSNSRTSSKRRRDAPHSLLAASLLAALLTLPAACGGSGNGSGNGGNTPPPAGQNPCATAGLEAEAATADAPPETPAHLIALKKDVLDGNPRGRVLDALWLHQSRAGRIPQVQSLVAGRSNVDVGEIAVIQDEGDLIEAPNTYDLRNLGLRFTRNAAGGYDVRRIEGGFRTNLGTRLTLTDDDSSQVNVPFTFSYYGRNQTAAFVNSDGNITFEEEDRASTDRNVARLLTGPPRVAAFFADLDPTTGVGRVFAHAASDQYTVTWCNVRGFDSSRLTTTQVTLLPDGTIEMKYDEVGLTEAIVGVSPGRTGAFTTVNLSDSGPTNGGAGAVGERFAERAQLDTVEVARKFYRTHGDLFDQLVIWTDTTVIQNAFAFESTVANEVRGIGVGIFDASRDFGSAGRLRSFLMMDFIGKYPDDPFQRFLGENNTLSVLGQETGHRWLAFLEFRNHTGAQSESLLGRDQAHWSFFFDSDASVMEGNDIEDLGGGSFRTVAAVQRYSRLDQYAMGLVSEGGVPAFFYVDNPTNVAGGRTAESAPAVGVTFNGTRRDVLIQDVTAVLGPRIPSVNDSPKVHRQAFILVVGAGRSQDNNQIAKIDRIRRAWEPFFLEATERRMQAITTLR